MGRSRRKLLAPAPFRAPEGSSLYLVGGAIRDHLLGETSKDHDWALGGIRPEEIDRLLHDAEPLEVAGERIGWRLQSGEEVALLRRETSSGPRHTDFDIDTDGVTIEEDLHRRDFTCNALALDTSTGRLIDPFGGEKDIREGVLRAISERAFREDPLRLLRGALLQARFDLQPTEETLRWMSETDTSHLSPERIAGEMRRLLVAPHRGKALRTLRSIGQYEKLFPELAATVGWDQQSRYHSLSCDEHCLQALENVEGSEALHWAAWLHDCGKPASAWMGDDGRLHYYAKDDHQSHEEVGEEIARSLMKRLRLPRDLQEDVAYLVRHHMWSDTRESWDRASEEKRDRKARRFLLRHGDYAQSLVQLRRADIMAKGRDASAELRVLDDFERRLQVAKTGTWRKLALDGNDLIRLGIQGPAVGEALRELQRRVCDEPQHNHREQLLRWAEKLARKYNS